MWYKIQNQQIQIKIYAKANAKRSNFLAISEKGMHISLHAKPHQGEANKELIAYLSSLFRIPKSQIKLVSGESSKHKQVLLPLNKNLQDFIAHPEKFIKKLS